MRTFIAAAVAAFLALPLSAQQFDVKAQSLPKDFKPANFGEVYKTLSSNTPVPAGLYVFSIDPLMVRADEKGMTKLTFMLDAVHEGRNDLKYEGLLTLASDSEGKGSFLGQTVFGAVAEVTTDETHRWGIRVPNKSRNRVIEFSIPVSADAKDHLRYFAVAELGPKSTPKLMTDDLPSFKNATGTSASTATLNNPAIHRVVEHAVPGRVRGIWIWDSNTGAIVGKYSLGGSALNPDGTVANPAEGMNPTMLVMSMRRGMTQDEVRTHFEPLEPVISTKDGQERWSYPDLKIDVFFTEGKVSAVYTKGSRDI
ncbi:MAG TPA: hypothetical protein VKB93_13710 [Thermoanaerobaculia bacterium]|nr:hypothetical protein [Thermoanaerobaculia bacterium]